MGYTPFEALFHLGRFGKEERQNICTAMDLLAVFKLEDYADEISKNLPYGLQRRLEIARAMATDPTLLLLDEPAAGMNPNEIDQLMEFIQWIRKEFKPDDHPDRAPDAAGDGHLRADQGAGFWRNHRRGTTPARSRTTPRCWKPTWAKEVSCEPESSCQMLAVKDLIVSYGNIRAVRGISFEVHEGEIVTLIGANGAGKSSTLRAISGMIPYKGTIHYNGKRPAQRRSRPNRGDGHRPGAGRDAASSAT